MVVGQYFWIELGMRENNKMIKIRILCIGNSVTEILSSGILRLWVDSASWGLSFFCRHLG